MITIKNTYAQQKMIDAGELLSTLFVKLQGFIEPGLTTLAVDKYIEDYLRQNKMVSCSKGYMGYRHSSCISVNDEVVHGVPRDLKIKEDDLIKVDVCADCTGEQEIDVGTCYTCNSQNLKTEEKFFPWQSDDKYKNRANLIRTIVWYLDHYKDSEEKTVILADGTPAVELWFRFELPLKSKAGESFFLTGHIDRLVELAGAFWFFDIKTSKNTISSDFFDKFSPDNQMSFYNAGGKVTLDKPLMGGVIDAIQVAVGFTRCQRGIIQQTPGLMEEWIKDIQYWIKQAEGYAEDNYWPRNDKACHNYGGCDFRGICNKDPAIRKTFLETHFKRKLWDPLKERKD